MNIKKITFSILVAFILLLANPPTTFAVFEPELGQYGPEQAYEETTKKPITDQPSKGTDAELPQVDDEGNLLVNIVFPLFGVTALTYVEVRTKLMKSVKAPRWMWSPWRLYLFNLIIFIPTYRLALHFL